MGAHKTKGTRKPPSAAEQARRKAFGKEYGAINASIGREIRAKRQAGTL